MAITAATQPSIAPRMVGAFYGRPGVRRSPRESPDLTDDIAAPITLHRFQQPPRLGIRGR
jgi:hypothetical protein